MDRSAARALSPHAAAFPAKKSEPENRAAAKVRLLPATSLYERSPPQFPAASRTSKDFLLRSIRRKPSWHAPRIRFAPTNRLFHHRRLRSSSSRPLDELRSLQSAKVSSCLNRFFRQGPRIPLEQPPRIPGATRKGCRTAFLCSQSGFRWG